MGAISSTVPPLTPPEKYVLCVSFCRRSTSNWIECFDPSNNSWTYLTRIPNLLDNHVLKNFALVSLNKSIYVIGGSLCQKDELGRNSNDSDQVIEVRLEVLRYDIVLNEWFECSPLKIPRYDFACTVSEGKIYVAGGKSDLENAKGTSTAEVYNPVTDEWSLLPEMSTLRYKCVGVTFGGKIYIVGGFAVGVDSDKSYGMERSSAEVYDTEAGKWDLVAGMWQLDVPPNQIVAVGGRLFSSGDCLKAWKGHIEAYDGMLWDVVDGSHLGNLNSPISTSDANSDNWPPLERLYLTMAPIGSHLYFLAGYRMAGESSRTVSMVHMFDTSATKDSWRSFEPMEEEGEKQLCTHCCAVEIS
ncbi:F-box/kelch-repeat protein At1g16250-like [Euphorbia lathyris]|uniref:F-box/kelch-repeat protein At1g16250-like n=1 Tax=Euphorbia lathyris TaxID=212925 RepID=UPI0033141858